MVELVLIGQARVTFGAFFEDVVFTLNGALLLGIGSVIGAVFAAVIFSLSAVSVPLLYGRPIDVITAISSSLLAVRENWRVMFGWAALILLISLAGIATFFVGLAVAIPLLAYATWHCYRDLIEPKDDDTVSANALAQPVQPAG